MIRRSPRLTPQAHSTAIAAVELEPRGTTVKQDWLSATYDEHASRVHTRCRAHRAPVADADAASMTCIAMRTVRRRHNTTCISAYAPSVIRPARRLPVQRVRCGAASVIPAVTSVGEPKHDRAPWSTVCRVLRREGPRQARKADRTCTECLAFRRLLGCCRLWCTHG